MSSSSEESVLLACSGGQDDTQEGGQGEEELLLGCSVVQPRPGVPRHDCQSWRRAESTHIHHLHAGMEEGHSHSSPDHHPLTEEEEEDLVCQPRPHRPHRPWPSDLLTEEEEESDDGDVGDHSLITSDRTLYGTAVASGSDSENELKGKGLERSARPSPSKRPPSSSYRTAQSVQEGPSPATPASSAKTSATLLFSAQRSRRRTLLAQEFLSGTVLAEDSDDQEDEPQEQRTRIENPQVR